MKALNMIKKTMKNSSLKGALLCLATLSISSTFAHTVFAGNGGGYNGPDLIPVSIPMAENQGLSTSEVNKVRFFCLASAPGREGILEQVFLQVYGKSRKKIKSEQLDVLETHHVGFHLRRWTGGLMGGEARDLSGILEKGWNLRIEFDGGNLMPDFPLPSVYVGSEMLDEEYNEFGKAVRSRNLMRELSIKVPENYSNNEPSFETVPMHDAKSLIASKSVTINFVDYVNCLRSEIPKLQIYTKGKW